MQTISICKAVDGACAARQACTDWEGNDNFPFVPARYISIVAPRVPLGIRDYVFKGTRQVGENHG